MKKILLIPCMVLALLVLFPVKSKAVESGFYLSNKFTYDYLADSMTDVVYEIYSDNPDAKIVVLTSMYFQSYNSYLKSNCYAFPVWVMSVGGDSNIKVYKNGVLDTTLSRNIKALDMSVINSNLLKNLTVGSYDSLAQIGALVGFSGSYYPAALDYNNSVTFLDIYGYFLEVPYDYDLGDPTYTSVKYAVENIETLKHQQEVYDSSLPVPVFSHYKDTVREYLRITNSSGYKVEMKIKIYGPSKIYINSVSINPKNTGLDMYEWAVKEEISSDLYMITNYLDLNDFYIWGLENYEIVENGNFVNLADTFSNFTQSCKNNCTFEYKDYFTQLQDSINKTRWDMLLSLANTDLYEYEIYSRFYDDSGITKNYGAWQHLVLERGGNFKQGTDDEGIVEIPEDGEDNRDDDNLSPIIPEVPYEYIDANDLWTTIGNLVSGMGKVPDIFSQIFGFMPSWLIYMLVAGIAAIVILRFTGR